MLACVLVHVGAHTQNVNVQGIGAVVTRWASTQRAMLGDVSLRRLASPRARLLRVEWVAWVAWVAWVGRAHRPAFWVSAGPKRQLR